MVLTSLFMILLFTLLVFLTPFTGCRVDRIVAKVSQLRALPLVLVNVQRALPDNLANLYP